MIGTSGSNLAIGISLILRDQFSGRANAASQSLTNLQQRSQRAQMEAARNANAIGAGVGVAALAGMREWVKVGADFGKQMTYMYSIAENKQGISIDKMKNKAMEVGANTMFSTTEVAKAMVTMAQAGQNAEQIHGTINSTAVLAAATMSDIQSSASTMNDIMIGFGINKGVKDLDTFQKNSMRVADIITKSINDSNIQLADFGESMKYIIPTATSLGIHLEEVAAMISTIGNAGIKGSMAGTNLENTLRYLAKAAGKEGGGKQVEALAMLGLAPGDLMAANGQLKSMAEIIPLLGGKLKQMSTNNIQGFNAMMDLLGVRGGRAGNLLAQGMTQYDKFLTGVNASQGAAQRTADDVMGSLWGTNEQLSSTWENLKIVFTEAIEPVLVPLIKGITWLVNGLRKMVETPIGKFLTILGAGFLVVRTAVMGYRAIVLSLRLLHGSLGSGFRGTASSIIGGYNGMTAAAQRYAAASGMAGMAGMGGYAAGRYGMMGMMGPATNMRMMQMMGYGAASRLGVNAAGRYFNKSTGRLVSNAVGERYTAMTYGRGGGMLGGTSAMTKFGRFAGNASPYAMIGGMALQMGSSAVGEETGLGRTMNVAGGALGWAGTGAMLGSVVPGIGTAVGAIVGGVGGLLWGIYDDAQRENERIKQAQSAADANSTNREKAFNPDEWRLNAQQYLSMPTGSSQYYRGVGDQMNPTNRAGANAWLANGGHYTDGKKTGSQIIINIDGKRAMDKKIEESKYETFVNLGM
jgi:TP901 family phage tail tape measure protein